MEHDEFEPRTAAAQHAHPVDELTKRCQDKQREFPQRQDELENARSRIAAETHLSMRQKTRAFERAADAITDGIRIFISYKFDDLELATCLKKKLADYCAPRVRLDESNNPDISVAELDHKGGDDWRQTIKGNIKRAHWFILLLPEIEVDRDWVVWEAGYFERGMCTEAGERLIVMHHPEIKLATQLENYQSVSSSPGKIKQLFDDLFFKPNAIAGMPRIALRHKQDDLAEDAKEIADKFYGPRGQDVPVFCLSYVDIKHQDDVAYLSEEDLLKAEVLDGHNLDTIFNRNDDFRGEFRDLVSDVYNSWNGMAWVDALRQALEDAVAKRPRTPPAIPFAGYGDRPKQFRAYLHCVRRKGTFGPISSFHIIFIEEFGSQVSNAPAELDALETNLRWSYRSWWDVMSRYKNRPIRTKEQLHSIKQYTELAEQEARAKGAADPSVLMRAFEKHPEEQKILMRFYEDYTSKYRNPVSGEGDIDVAFKEDDMAKMTDCIETLRPMLAWFLIHGAKIYAELLEQKLSKELVRKDAIRN